MNRTTWHSGQTPLNILVLGVALGGVVLLFDLDSVAPSGQQQQTALEASQVGVELIVVKRPEAVKGFILLPKR